MSRPDRLAMVDRRHAAVSVRRQCALLGVARAVVYRPRPGPGPEDLALMRRLDALYLEAPFYGSRRMIEALRRDGIRIGRHRVRRLMRLMGLEALAPKPGSSRPAPGHRIYPYLLRGLAIDRPNQVWAADITYIPMARGFLYLVAIIDWFSRAVLAWRLSNTMDAAFCVEALEAALMLFGRPEIFNTDQGAQFTSAAFTGRLEAAGTAISMDGRGRWLDCRHGTRSVNVFVERLWRSLKYEEVHLKAYTDGREARAGIGAWIAFYNDRRPHQALGYRTPMEVWRGDRESAVDMPPGTLAGGWTTLTRCPHAHSRNNNSNPF